MDQLALGFQLAVQGVLLGGIYGLIAVGLSLIFGVMGIINFAHGQMIVLGMYISYSFLVLFGIDPYLNFIASAGILFAMGYLLQSSTVNRILDFPEAMQVVPLVAVGLVLENLTLMLWGPDHRSPETAFNLSTIWIGKIMIDGSKLITFVLAIVLTLGVFLFLKKSSIGKSIRAAADNRTGAVLVGINVNRINNFAFGLGAATCGAAGALLLPLMPVSPHMGHDFTLTAFVVVILGGMGNLWGALLGGLILGLTESLSILVLPPTMKQVVSFILLIIIMLFRPQGLLKGRK